MFSNKDLPTEVFDHVGIYLNHRQHIMCSLVCKSWNTAFRRLVWYKFEINNDKYLRLNVDSIRGNISWIRSLVLKDCQCTILFSSISTNCTQLRSLDMTAEHHWREYYSKGTLDNNYWKAFNGLVKQNRKSLVSLTLRNVSLPTSKSNNGGPYLSPLMIIANYPHSNLRALRIECSELPYRHLQAFWDLCERVEVLELHDFPFEMPHHYIDRRGTSGTRMPPQEERVVHFSNLLELTLIRSGPKNLLSQLEEVIRKAPKLKKLDWTPYFSIWFPLPWFMYLFTGDAKYFRPTTPVPQHSAPLETCTTPCWPDLESLKIDYRYSGHFDVEDYFAILEMSKKIRFLDVPVSPTFPTELEPLFRLHSHTLTMVDWRNNLGIQNVDLVHRIFSSCPLLTKAYFKPIHGQELIRGGDSWVCCDQLEELRVCINMEPLEYDPHNPQRKQDLSWAVFKQLGKLRNLRILDLRRHTTIIPFTEHLEFTTSMGLQQLSKLNELEVLRFEVNQNMTLEDVNWIIEHWTSLAEIDGGMLTTNRSRFSTRKNPWDYTLATMLNKRGVRTPKSVYSVTDISRFDKEIDWDYDEPESIPSGDQVEENPLDYFDFFD